MSARTWDPKYEAELARLHASRQPQETAKVAALSPSDRARYQGFVAAVCDILVIVDIYIKGFEHLQKSNPADVQLTSHALHWIHHNDGRSPRRIAGMIATNLCSLLEEFLVELAAIRLTPAFIQRLPRTFTSSLHLRNRSAHEVRKAILKNVRPSVRGDGTHWISVLRTVFSINFDPATEGTLLLMIDFRNKYVHEPGKVMSTDTTSGDEVFSWAKAVLLLAHDAVLGP